MGVGPDVRAVQHLCDTRPPLRLCTGRLARHGRELRRTRPSGRPGDATRSNCPVAGAALEDLRQEFRITCFPTGRNDQIQRVGRFVQGHGHGLMAGTSVDVTERRASENAVRETEQQYREALGALYQAERVARAEAERARSDAEIVANRAKTEFLAVMSHELRTPLNERHCRIHGPARVRHPRTSEPPNSAKIWGRIQRAEQHLLGLINQVLSYAPH